MEIDKIDEFVRKKGFFWQSSEIYGGLAGFYDYGNNGTLLKRKFENVWRKYFLGLNENFVEIEPSNIMHKNVFAASGHLNNFVDPVAKCSKCGTQHRADHILEDFLKENFEGLTIEELKELIKKYNIKCPNCKGEFKEFYVLNMMFSINIGEKDKNAFMRPETAQGAFTNFMRQYNILRNRLPMGLAIIGKVFRNEISPRNLITRTREFTQAELQIFFDFEEIENISSWDEIKDYKIILNENKKNIEITCNNLVSNMKIPKFYVYYMSKIQKFYLDILKIPKEKFRFRKLSNEEKAFYNKIHFDIELDLLSLGGFKEVGGIHYRTDYDLKNHEKLSGKSQKVFLSDKKKKIIPHVIELSFGVDRNIYSLIEIFHKKDRERIFLNLPSPIVPFEIAVFPLVNKSGLDIEARKIFENLSGKFDAVFDHSGSIGKMYYREDERGTLYCITIDYGTKETGKVTLRDRNTKKQIFVKIEFLESILRNLLDGKIKFEEIGKIIK